MNFYTRKRREQRKRAEQRKENRRVFLNERISEAYEKWRKAVWLPKFEEIKKKEL